MSDPMSPRQRESLSGVEEMSSIEVDVHSDGDEGSFYVIARLIETNRSSKIAYHFLVFVLRMLLAVMCGVLAYAQFVLPSSPSERELFHTNKDVLNVSYHITISVTAWAVCRASIFVIVGVISIVDACVTIVKISRGTFEFAQLRGTIPKLPKNGNGNLHSGFRLGTVLHNPEKTRDSIPDENLRDVIAEPSVERREGATCCSRIVAEVRKRTCELVALYNRTKIIGDKFWYYYFLMQLVELVLQLIRLAEYGGHSFIRPVQPIQTREVIEAQAIIMAFDLLLSPFVAYIANRAMAMILQLFLQFSYVMGYMLITEDLSTPRSWHTIRFETVFAFAATALPCILAIRHLVWIERYLILAASSPKDPSLCHKRRLPHVVLSSIALLSGASALTVVIYTFYRQHAFECSRQIPHFDRECLSPRFSLFGDPACDCAVLRIRLHDECYQSDLERLKQYERVEHLRVVRYNVGSAQCSSDESIELQSIVTKLVLLRHLFLDGVALTNWSIGKLEKLEVLSLFANPLTTAAAHLENYDRLTSINLVATEATIFPSVESMKSELETVTLAGTPACVAENASLSSASLTLDCEFPNAEVETCDPMSRRWAIMGMACHRWLWERSSKCTNRCLEAATNITNLDDAFRVIGETNSFINALEESCIEGACTALQGDSRAVMGMLKESIRKSNVKIGGNEEPTYVTVAAESYIPHEIHPADFSVHKQNAAVLRRSNIHMAQNPKFDPYLRDRQTSTSKASYTMGAITIPRPGDVNFGKGPSGRNADEQKKDLESTHFAFGYHPPTPRMYQSVTKGDQEATSKALLGDKTSVGGGTKEGRENLAKQLRAQSICFGSDAPTYKSTSAAALVDHTAGGAKTGSDPRAARQCAAKLRVSNFRIGGYSNRAPEYITTTGTAHNAEIHRINAMQRSKGLSSDEADVKRRNYKASFHLGSDRPMYTSETVDRYSANYEAFLEACKHPQGVSQAEKDDLRRQHFVFGMSTCDDDARKDRMESISASAYKDHSNAMVADNTREEMLKLKADLRKPHFSFASLSQSSAGVGIPVSVAKATYTLPPVSAYLEGADSNIRQERKIDLESAHFVFGVGKEEELRDLRSTSVAKNSYKSIPAQAYRDRGLDPRLKADLRSHHFELGVAGGGLASRGLPVTTSQDAYKSHPEGKPASMPEEVRKDLRQSHFNIGRGASNPDQWITTQARAMVAHPTQSSELDKSLKADLRAAHFTIGAPGKFDQARTISQTDYIWPDLALGTASAVKGI
ncbi:hypothetical protein FOL47_003538 [Perkinsus chesapeaki]|uniref:Uncharacterized protein n=1 Tax=Perkinsus chesapeaki TaxID=330153 RepID=A0A7J6N0G5_PERCH|nr:hypothetical protein FOL47_003538 [Perkinsus chesapeaki]